jgi:hypothetical protein
MFGNTEPATCRDPQPVEVPDDPTEIVATAREPIGPDVACAILGEAAAPVLGLIELAASARSSCIGWARTATG